MTSYIYNRTTLEGTKISGNTYQNTVQYNDGQDRILESNIIEPVYAEDKDGNPNIIKSDGKQVGDIAHWQVIINAAQDTIKEQMIFSDMLSNVEEQRFIKDSVKIYKVQNISEMNTDYLANITSNNLKEVKFGEDINSPSNLQVQEGILTFNFPAGLSETYIVQYDTLLIGDNGTYGNSADFYSDGALSSGDKDTKSVAVSWANAGAGALINSSGHLQIKKVSPLGQQIAGIEFEVKDANGKYVLETITTGADGIATTTNKYKYKNYQIVEKDEPTNTKGYTSIGTKTIDFSKGKEVTYSSDKASQMVVENQLSQTTKDYCENATLTITNPTSQKVDKIEILVGTTVAQTVNPEATKETVLDGGTTENPSNVTFELNENLAKENYQVKLYVDGKQSIIKKKADFTWDFKTYDKGVAINHTDCAAKLQLTEPTACEEVTVTFSESDKWYRNIK